jgi:hypothetical protein
VRPERIDRRVQRDWRQAMENRAYVRALLRERQPEFLAMLQSAEREFDLERSRSAQGRRLAHPG